MSETKKLKRSVIKEELVELTGDFIKAVILNQFIYWSERMKDIDEYIEQENQRATQYGGDEQELSCGWIYKSADDLADETMLNLSGNAIRNHLKELERMGFVCSRTNPKYKWDRTLQYRVDLVRVIKSLNKMGYSLDGYALAINIPTEPSGGENPNARNENASADFENGSAENEIRESDDCGAIPEITTETTTKTTAKKKERKKTSYDEILSVVEDESLRDLYYEYIKMRKLIKSPMTDRALQMLLDKVNKLEPNNIEYQKRMLEVAIMNNWKSVYPLKEDQKQECQKAGDDKKAYGGTWL